MKLGLGIVFLLAGLLFLLIYPFVLVANAMSLGGKGPVPFSAWAFFYGSIAYPMVYIPCVVAWLILRRKERVDAALRASGIPGLYVLDPRGAIRQVVRCASLDRSLANVSPA